MAAKQSKEPNPEPQPEPVPQASAEAPLAVPTPTVPPRHGPPVWLWVLISAVAAVSIYFAGIATAVGIAVVDRHLSGPVQERSQQVEAPYDAPADGMNPERGGPGADRGTGGERPGPGSGERPSS